LSKLHIYFVAYGLVQWWPARQAAKAPLYKASTRANHLHKTFFRRLMSVLSLENIVHCCSL